MIYSWWNSVWYGGRNPRGPKKHIWWPEPWWFKYLSKGWGPIYPTALELEQRASEVIQATEETEEEAKEEGQEAAPPLVVRSSEPGEALTKLLSKFQVQLVEIEVRLAGFIDEDLRRKHQAELDAILAEQLLLRERLRMIELLLQQWEEDEILLALLV